jgi:hypothetical protein
MIQAVYHPENYTLHPFVDCVVWCGSDHSSLPGQPTSTTPNMHVHNQHRQTKEIMQNLYSEAA